MALSMSQGFGQQMRQRQEMTLTREMLQSMEILQLQRLDLEQRLEREVDQNPALERAEFADDRDPDRDDYPIDNDPDIDARYSEPRPDPDGDYDYNYDSAPAARDARELRVEADERPADEIPPDDFSAPFGNGDNDGGDGDGGGGGVGGGAAPHFDDVDGNLDFDNWHDDDRSPRRERGAPGSGGGGDDEPYDPIAQLAARGPSYTDHLAAQLGEEELTPRSRALALGIVDKLDADGWLRFPLSETVPVGFSPPPARAELEAALASVQKLDPAGTAARDLRECLALQLDRRADEDPYEVARRLVRSELENLAANRLPLIARNLDCSLDEVKRAADLIRSCQPRPGADFDARPAAAVRPDVRIVPDEGEGGSDGDGLRVVLPGGAARVEISDFWLALFERTPRARVLRGRFLADPVEGPAFRALSDKLRVDPEAARRYRALYDSANGLMKAVSMRDQTLRRVAEAIVEAQGAYLRGDSDAPAPLSMQEVAQRVGYDESTISRTVKDKYAETPRGILPLRDFFVRGAATAPPASPSTAAAPVSGREGDGGGDGGGEALSSRHIINRLRAMIEGEDKKKPLRDNELLDRLAADGFRLARRTVANYRAQLGYPSHTKRREY